MMQVQKLMTLKAQSESKDDMSDDESVTSMPFSCFNNCDAPLKVDELERALQDSRHNTEEKSPSLS